MSLSQTGENFFPSGRVDAEVLRVGLGPARENPKLSQGGWTQFGWLCPTEQGMRTKGFPGSLKSPVALSQPGRLKGSIAESRSQAM